jgi:uncharacterized protein YqhQ
MHATASASRERGNVPKMNECPNVGGQAVIEGVMMRCPNSLAIAVRRPGGEISVKDAVWRSIWNRLGFLRWPFLRGTIVMAEAMVNGMQALNFSAREAMTDEEKAEAEAAGEGAVGKLAFVMPMLLGLAVVILLFKFAPHMAATYAGELFVGRTLTVDDWLYHLIDGVVKVAIFVAYVVGISLLKDIRRVFMYHGAEHMSIYTFEAGEELTVENAREKSTLHPRCGTAFIMVVILVFIIVAALLLPFMPEWAKPGPDKPWYNHLIVVLLKLPLLIPVAGLSYEFNRFAGRHVNNPLLKPLLWPGLAMQLLTTKKPTDDQLEIALAALRMALWREDVGDRVPYGEEPRVFKDFESFGEHDEAATASVRAAP